MTKGEDREYIKRGGAVRRGGSLTEGKGAYVKEPLDLVMFLIKHNLKHNLRTIKRLYLNMNVIKLEM